MPRGVYPRGADGLHGQTPVPLYELVPVGETWRDHAACSDHPTLKPETWDDSLPNETRAQRTTRMARGIAVCKTCPVRRECARDADLEWDSGVRGGVDLRELKEARKRKGRAS